MKIYRYEKPDGGGPFVTPDGFVRDTGFKVIPYADGAIYGCASIEKLIEYFSIHPEVELNDCIIKEYEVSQNNIIKLSNREIIFIP